MIINLNEEFKKKDKSSDFKYNLLETYQSNSYSAKTKKELAEAILNNESNSKLLEMLDNNSNKETINFSEKYLEQFNLSENKKNNDIHYYGLFSVVFNEALNNDSLNVINVCTSKSLEKANSILKPLDEQYVVEILEEDYDNYFKTGNILNEGPIWDKIKQGAAGVKDAIKQKQREKHSDAYNDMRDEADAQKAFNKRLEKNSKAALQQQKTMDKIAKRNKKMGRSDEKTKELALKYSQARERNYGQGANSNYTDNIQDVLNLVTSLDDDESSSEDYKKAYDALIQYANKFIKPAYEVKKDSEDDEAREANKQKEQNKDQSQEENTNENYGRNNMRKFKLVESFDFYTDSEKEFYNDLEKALTPFLRKWDSYIGDIYDLDDVVHDILDNYFSNNNKYGESYKRKPARSRRLKESQCSIDECQKWVDYDMKKYHRISDDTMQQIRDSGFSVVKDQYGDYEVIADRKDESFRKLRRR